MLLSLFVLLFCFDVRPIPTSAHGKRKIFVFKDLKNASHVFLRKDHVKKPLERSYDGPFKVLEKNYKIFTLLLRHEEKKVSIDRVKPAYIEAPVQQDNSGSNHHKLFQYQWWREGQQTKIPLANIKPVDVDK
jgi:hypothetical protein